MYYFGTPVLDLKQSEVPGSEAGIFWELYALQSSSRFLSRVTIGLLLGISFGLFACVFAQHIWEGMRYVIPVLA